MIPEATHTEALAFLRVARGCTDEGKPTPDPVLPPASEVAAHLKAGGSWLVIYRGGGTVRCYRGTPSQAVDVLELLESGVSLRWWQLPAESEDAS